MFNFFNSRGASNKQDVLRWPTGLTGSKAPHMVVLLHGHGGNAEQMQSLVLPEPPALFNAIALNGPFDLDDGSRTWADPEVLLGISTPFELRAELLQAGIELIESTLHELQQNGRIHLVGYSLGASVVSALIARNPERYLSACMCNGVIQFSDLEHSDGDRGPPCFVSTGSLDNILSPRIIEQQVEDLKARRWNIWYREYHAPHVVNRENRNDLYEFLRQQVLTDQKRKMRKMGHP